MTEFRTIPDDGRRMIRIIPPPASRRHLSDDPPFNVFDGCSARDRKKARRMLREILRVHP